jgi:hypothetical protein
MSRCTTIGCGLVLAALLAVGSGCSRGAPRIHPPSISASGAAARAIKMFDANGDGKLTGAELDKCPGLKSAAARLDPDGRGITAEMIAARITSWQGVRIGRMPVVGTVLHNGKPLAGAMVRFVPEKFLGLDDDPKWIATGTTGQSGGVSVSVPTSGDQLDPPGAPAAFYRIEVTKPGLNIPAKYNTETVLGEEIAMDVPALRDESKGIVLNLKF